MDKDKFKKLKASIKKHSESLKNPPKENQTNKRQYDDTLEKIRTERKSIMNSSYEMVADYLFTEGYVSSFEDALIVADCISEEWYNEIVESKDLVQQIALNLAHGPLGDS